ncbi:hypothetical protein ACN28I_06915 [Archangium gephyra]|uniref:hypothetical protein n=1 Tax=Archangium gephyra TaxID=48 RepID=UPI003B7A6E98
MAYVIELPEHLFSVMDELSRRTSTTIHLMLERIAELADTLPRDDERWKQFAYHDGQGMRFYVHGCCVQFRLEPEEKRVVVYGISRVLVRLPYEMPDFGTGSEGSPAQQ